MICSSCANEFVQPFVYTTCGAQRLRDETVRMLEKENAALRKQLEWVGLTDAEAKQVWTQLNYDMSHGKFATDDTRHVIVEFYQAIEAKLKDKNGG